MRISNLVVAAALTLAGGGSAFAEATILPSEGTALVNLGKGFAPAVTGARIETGSRLLVQGKKNVTLRFADGCSVSVPAGKTMTIGKVSPCAYKASLVTMRGNSMTVHRGHVETQTGDVIGNEQFGGGGFGGGGGLGALAGMAGLAALAGLGSNYLNNNPARLTP